MGNESIKINDNNYEIPLNKIILIQKAWRKKRKIKKLILKNKITITTSSNNSLPGMEIENFDADCLITKEAKETENKIGEFTLLNKKKEKFNNDKNYIKIKRLYNNNTIYIGTINKKNLLKEGFGILFNINEASKYTGEFYNDQFNGIGRFLFNDGSYYEGMFENGLQKGYGKYEYENYSYIGNWINNKKNGFGEENFPDNSNFKGYFIDDHKEGIGIFKYPNCNKSIEGNFNKNNEINGICRMISIEEEKISIGIWEKGKMNGLNIFIWGKENKIFFGEYKNFIKNGFGVYFFEEQYLYMGFWINGYQHGYGIIKDLINNNKNLYFFRYGKEISEIKENDDKYNDYNNLIENKNKEFEQYIKNQFNIDGILDKKIKEKIEIYNFINK